MTQDQILKAFCAWVGHPDNPTPETFTYPCFIFRFEYMRALDIELRWSEYGEPLYSYRRLSMQPDVEDKGRIHTPEEMIALLEWFKEGIKR